MCGSKKQLESFIENFLKAVTGDRYFLLKKYRTGLEV